jgi:DNA-binding XRE family transcriptional regulator
LLQPILFGEIQGGHTQVHYITLLQYNASLSYHINMSSGKRLGDNLRKLRLKKNLSQGDLATALNVDRAYISNIENGRMNPTLSTLEKIAKALGISSSELLK